MGSDLHGSNRPPWNYGHNADIFIISLDHRAYLVVAKNKRAALDYIVDVNDSDSAWRNAIVEWITSMYVTSPMPYLIVEGQLHEHLKGKNDHKDVEVRYKNLASRIQKAGIPVLSSSTTTVQREGVYYNVNQHVVIVYEDCQEALETFMGTFGDLQIIKIVLIKEDRVKFYIEEL